MSLMRLAYASEATFKAKPVEKGIEPHVARILMTSRRNNAKSQLVGGLYYGDDHFFQYLEGEEEEVRKTFQRIAGDERHKNVKTLLEEPLSSRTFTNWSMKYIPTSSDVRKFLASQELERFNPTDFSRQQCEAMIDLIRESSHDQKLVNYDSPDVAQAKQNAFSPAIRTGLIVAAVCLIGAVVFAGTML